MVRVLCVMQHPDTLTYLFTDRKPASSRTFDAQSDGVAIAGPGHMIQFYEESTFISGTLREFVGTGLHAGHACIIIATPEHIRELEGQLVDAISQSATNNHGYYRSIDAQSALQSMMVDGLPDWQRFLQVIGKPVQEACAHSHLVRVYAEMIPLLWETEKYEAALHLEKFLQQFAVERPIFVYSAYPKRFAQRLLAPGRSGHTLNQANIINAVLPELQTEIQHRKETEQALEKLEACNSGLVAERDYLRELNNAKDEFISLASHQLRTPATGVKQYIGMLLQGFMGDLTDVQRSGLQKAYESNERQLKIVNDLLLVARVDAGKITINTEPVELVRLIKDVANEQQEEIKARGQHLVLRLPRELTVQADARYLRMVIENLLNNASKYSGDGLPITVQAGTHGGFACITVRDKGVGISKQDMPKLYQKFSRIYNQRSSVVDGTGLGLYWSKKIIELSCGTLTVKSRIGQGSAFTISLPVENL